METLAPVYERLFIECGDSLFVPNGIKWSGTMSASGITWGSSPFLEFMGSPELSFIAKERNATKAEEVNENLAAKSTTIAFVTAEAVRTFDFRPGPMASDAIDLTRLNGTDILGGSLTSPYRQDGSAVPTNAFVGFDLNTRTLRDGTQKIELDFGRFSVFAPEDFKEERENILPATFEHIIRNKSRLVPIGCSDLRNPVIYAAKFALLKDPNGAELALAEKFFSWFTRGSGVDAKSRRNAFESAGVRSDLLTPHAQNGGAAKLSVETTPISEIIKNGWAKAALEAALPPIAQYYDQVGSMTLKDVAPMSQGALDDAKLKELQTIFDSIS